MSDTRRPKSKISAQTVILLAVLWAVVSLIVFLLGSPISPRPQWYGIATYALENLAFLGAALLCLRNWRSSQIVSGRGVWLLFAIGMLSYFMGNLILGWWELVWDLSPDVSPADFFYLLTYLALGVGMLLAVISKRLSLTAGQYGIVAAIAVGGLALAYYVSYGGAEDSARSPYSPSLMPAAVAQAPPPSAAPPETPSPSPEAPPAAPVPQANPAPTPPEGTVPPPAEVEPPAEASSAPAWVVALNEQLSPFADPVGLLYVAGDVFLLVMATILLLAFWGGRFSTSWRFIAAAAFSFYIADIWFAYAISQLDNYETGELPEVFWIFSAVLFSIGAALEYSLSTRSRRVRRRS
ncbi:MAG: hypothetical protein AAF289_09565 [Cyanobacteria bacterium P01_A01_bin.135]